MQIRRYVDCTVLYMMHVLHQHPAYIYAYRSPREALSKKQADTNVVFLLGTRGSNKEQYLTFMVMFDMLPWYPHVVVTWSRTNLSPYGVKYYPSLWSVKNDGTLMPVSRYLMLLSAS